MIIFLFESFCVIQFLFVSYVIVTWEILHYLSYFQYFRLLQWWYSAPYICEEPAKEYTVEELVELLFDPVEEKVYVAQPTAVYHNYCFVPEHTIKNPPHKSSKSAIPYKRTHPSTLQRMKQVAKDHKPSSTFELVNAELQ